ncbi:MAG: SDR family NAD(P)-dependent oxidoreductase [Halioglobus sp.]
MTYAANKIAVVTGAGSGIGRALAIALNTQGCELYLSDINASGLSETLSLLPQPSIPADTTVLDAADKDGMHAWAERIDSEKGRVDIVVNNAGVALMSTVEKTEYEDIEWLMGINFWGVVYGTKAFLPLLHRSPEANLINISSVFGIISVPTQSAYNAAKFAVRGYTEALRQELTGTNIHVCCVHPGGIKTNIARSARGGDPNESPDERGDRFQKMAGTTPTSAAEQILHAAQRRKPRLLIGWDAKLLTMVSRLFPTGYPKLLALFIKTKGEDLI